MAPYLISDPYLITEDQPTEFYLYIDGSATPVVSSAYKKPDNTVILHHDLSSISIGTHTFVVKARLVDALWGVIESDDSTPFTFIRKSKPKKPSSFTIVSA